MVEDGVLDTFINEDIVAAFRRVTPSTVQRGVKGWQDTISQFANFVQQRQRAGLYLELLRKGASREEARRLTRAAYYDWKHGIGQQEARVFARWIPFYRFWRLALAQGMTAITDPITRPDGEFWRAVAGQSKLGRVRAQATVVREVPDWVNPPFTEDYEDLEAQRDEMARYLHPDWMADRPLYEVAPTKDSYLRALQEQKGRVYTHTATTLPPLTAIDVASMYGSLLSSVVALGATLGGRDDLLAPDWEESFWAPVVGFLAPWVSTPLKQALASMGAATGSKRGTTTRISAGDAALMGRIGMEVWQDAETGEHHTHTLGAVAFNMIPLFGNQLPVVANMAALENPAVLTYRRQLDAAQRLRQRAATVEDPREQERLVAQAERLEDDAPDEIGAATWWMLRRWMGAGPHPFAPEVEVEYRRRAMRAALGETARPAERRPFGGYATRDEGP
jgi:hypothetical protein